MGGGGGGRGKGEIIKYFGSFGVNNGEIGQTAVTLIKVETVLIG